MYGTPEFARRSEDVENRLLLVGLGEVADVGKIGRHVRRAAGREQNEGHDLLVADPVLGNAAPRIAVRVQFAALQRKACFRAARIAEDLAHLQPEHVPQDGAVDVDAGAGARCSEDDLLALGHIIPVLHARGVPRVAHAEIARDAADPAILGEIDVRLFRMRQRFRDEPVVERDDVRAVGRQGTVQPLDRGEAACARRILHNDVGAAGNMPVEMTREDARILIVTAARREADHEVDAAPLVELGRRLGERRAARARMRAPETWTTHAASTRSKQACYA